MANTFDVPRRGTPAWAFLVGATSSDFVGGRRLPDRPRLRARPQRRSLGYIKGLAESFVTADLAVWPLRIAVTGNDLARVQEQIDRDLSTVIEFLRSRKSSRGRSSRDESR